MAPHRTATPFTDLALVAGLLLALGHAPAWLAELSAQVQPSLPRYDLTAGAAAVRTLPRAITEISGLAFDAGGRLFAHNDELARVHQLDPATGAIVRTFAVGARGTQGDFEGIAIARERFFLITAGGTLLEFEEPANRDATAYRRTDTGLGQRCELEGLAYDPATEVLLAPCKTGRTRALSERLTVFAIPLRTLRPDAQPRISIAFAELEAAGLADGFHPSSIEVHPRSGTYLLISAQEEVLMELSPDGRLLGHRELSRRRHPQPEGLAFGPDLALWIADEGGDGRGSLTRYPLADRAR